MKYGFPAIWNEEFLKVHNCAIASSIMIHRNIIDKIGYFSNQLWAPDYDYWLRTLYYTNSVYIKDICFYYDGRHGGGQNW